MEVGYCREGIGIGISVEMPIPMPSENKSVVRYADISDALLLSRPIYFRMRSTDTHLIMDDAMIAALKQHY